MQINIGVMLILRTYALYERNLRVLTLMLVFGACVLGACIWGTIFSEKKIGIWPSPNLKFDIGCTHNIALEQNTGLIIAWASLGIFDAFIFSLTLYRALRRRHLTDVHLLNVLLRDGSLYFGIMLGATISNILTFIYGGPYTRGAATTFTNIISSIMISRLMLNIRDLALREGEEGVFSTYMDPDELSTHSTNGWL
ncbi:hypothetical protein MVEN_01318000 [Mycena venus]|uniref:Uncharacterized protein n=1 Tax=Mycena venus TaxID=2733690 RepID=A0A8H7CTY6_9AGAR|nr:hypothetical protein MVEN_01318000 [Mycena venus]